MASLAVAGVPLIVAAQSAATVDSSPFRAGQWGAGVGLGNFAIAGVLRFLSPSKARVGSATAFVERRNAENDIPRPRKPSSFDLSLGHRWFRPVTPRIRQYATVGAIVGYSSAEVPTRGSVVGEPIRGAPLLTTERVAGGAFADLGVQWLVTPQLALGANWQTQATVGRQTEGGGIPGTVVAE